MIDFAMPSLGADMDEGMLVAWHVAPGDVVTRGQIIAEVETDKGIIDVECWHDGAIVELLVEPGPQRLAVGTVLARIATEQPAVVAAPQAPAAEQEPPGRSVSRPPAMTPPQRMRGVRRRSGGRVKASPRARRLAERDGIDLAAIATTRSDGLIVAADLPAEQRDPMREAIARSMERSKREIPHYYLGLEIDLSRALEWLGELNEPRGIADRVLPACLLLKATARALSDVPEFNGHYVDGRFHQSAAVHLGVAVSLRGGGLVAPAIHDADGLTIEEMMVALRDLVARARSGRLRSSEMSDPTTTVTNLGDRGVDETFAVIVPPQVAMVGFGKVNEKPVAVDGSVAVRPVVHASLAADHRVTDGHRGGLFLSAVDSLLQKPEVL